MQPLPNLVSPWRKEAAILSDSSHQIDREILAILLIYTMLY